MNEARIILEHYGFKNITDNGDSLRACCKLHGGNNPNSFIMNKQELVWYCHACGKGGNVYKLITLMEDVDPEEKFTELTGSTYVPPSAYRVEAIKWVNEQEVRDPPMLEIELGNIVKYDRFKESTLKRFNAVAYDEVTINGRTYKNKLMIPLRSGYELRSIDGSTPKCLYTKGMRTSDILFRTNKVEYDTILVVEGIMDVFAIYEAMEEYDVGDNIEIVCTFTCHMSDKQAKEILEDNCKVVMCYDGDARGQLGIDQAYDKLQGKTELHRIELPDGKDPDDVPRWWLGRELTKW